MSTIGGKNKENYFKTYDETGVESEDGKTLFRPVDRIRLIYSSILDVIDISTLESESIIKGEFAIHDKKELEKL